MVALVGRGKGQGLAWLLAQLVHYMGLAIQGAVSGVNTPWAPEVLQTVGPRRKADRDGATLLPGAG
eukprot:8053491-Lingulodinium_polyedra.AAC.1